jgi:2-polyprenyl-3-methyl-5-hydroxy-6-metoxy-1,4-benzoquinol methylase
MASSERQENNTLNPWWGEHVHRYHEALKLVNGSSEVMDIACGTGFGSFLIAEKAKSVVGCDISEEAIQYCNHHFKKSNLRFRVEDGTQLSFPSASFDIVISFETIEHTTQFHHMLGEFKRVLKNGGTAIISTPNFPVNSPSGKVTNPYHTQEFTYEELQQILHSHFSGVSIFGQKYIRYDTVKGISMHLGRIAESLLYRRGIRKLPLSIQDALMKALIRKPVYPQPDDYAMVTLKKEILSCKTFYAVCKA